MSREIDERLVAMRFDNEQFEEGVKESLASLAALREGLDLNGAADSFNEVSKASEKYLQFKEPSKAAENLHTALSKVGSVAKAAFGGMTAPIKTVGNAINGVYKDVSRLFGLDIAYNLEQSAIKTLRAFTVEPLSTGFQEYETKVDSLKTIMTSTVETYTNKLRQQSAEALEQAEKERDAEIEAANERYAAEKKALEAEAKREKLSKEEKATRLEILNAQKEEAEKAAKERYGARESQLVSYDERAHREVVKKSIEELNTYADNTIYNFQEMMKALPTLTNVGVEIEAATSMVKGMSNLAAYAGKGATEATFALRNLGQAMSLGYFQLMDWKTMEQQGLNTRDFVKTAIQMGLKTGTLIERNGKVYAQEMLEKYDRAIAEGQAAASKKKKQEDADETLRKAKEKAEEYLEEVTADNFRETLKYKWFDKATIEDTFKIFSGDLTELDLLKMGYDSTADRDLINWFLNLGKEATTAATQVRTFSKMMESLKEAAQSGWAISYEYIFGDDEQATKFWTPISNAISDVLDASADSRNEALKGWSESFVNIDGQVKTTRDAIRDAIIQLVNVFATVKNAVTDAWGAVFGRFDKKRLTDITKGFANFASSLQKWLGDKSVKDSRINKISSALEGFFTVFKVVFGTVKDVFGWVGEKLSPIFDWLFDKFTAFGTMLGTKFKGAKNLKDVFDVLKSSSSGGLKTAVDWFASIPDKISSKWKSLKEWYSNSPIKGVVDNVWSGILSFFKAPEGVENGKSGFDNLVAWMIGAYANLSAKWNEVLAWWNNPNNRLHGVVDNVWSGILSFFKAPEGVENGKSGFASTVEWLQGTWDKVKNWKGWNEISEFVSNSGIGGKIQSGLTKLFDAVMNLLNPGSTTVNKKRTSLDNARLLASGGISDVSYVDFDEKDSIITKFMNFVSRMKADWETAKANMDDLIKDIPNKIDSFRQTLSKFFGGDGEDSWDSIFDSAVEDAKGLGEVGMLFSGASALSGLGKLFKGTGKLEKYIGKTVYKSEKEGHTLGGVLSTLVKRVTTPFADVYTREGSKSITGWIENFRPFEGASDFKSTSGKVKDFATAALEFAGALWVVVDAFNRVAEITKDESIDFEKTGLIVGQIAGLITAFEVVTGVTSAIGARKFGSFTGIIGFVFGIEAIFKAFTSIITVTKNLTEEQIKEATILIEKMAGMITTFTMINDLSMLGKHGNMFGAATGLIGFTYAVTSLVNSFKDIIAIVAADEFRKHDYDRAVELIGIMSGIVTAFTAINDLSMIGKHGGMFGSAAGLVGFAYAIQAILVAFKDILGITSAKDFSQDAFNSAGTAIAQISLLVTAFSGINGTLGHSTFGSAVGLIGFAVTIQSMITALGKITDAYGKNGKESVDGAVNVLRELAAVVNTFSIYKGLGTALGNMPSMFGNGATSGNGKGGSGLIGFAFAIEAMITAVSRIAAIDNVKSLDSAVVILDKLGWIIDRFQIFTGVKGMFIGAASQLNDKGKLKSPNGASGIIGFVLAISGLVYDLSVLSNIDPTKADKAAEMLQKISDMINLFVGIDALKQAATSLEGFSGMSGKAVNIGKVIDFAGLAGFVGSIVLLVDKVIEVSKDTDLEEDRLGAILPVFTTLGSIIQQLSTSIGVFELLNSFAGKLGTGTGSGWATGTQAFVNLLQFVGEVGLALWGFGAGLKALGVTDDQLKGVADDIHSITPVVQAITGELGAFIGSFAGGIAGSFEAEKMNLATSGIDESIQNLSKVSPEDLDKLKISVAALKDINETLPNKTFWELISGSKMENFAHGMDELGNGFASFYSGISLVTDWSLFTRAVEGMQAIVTLGSMIADYSTKGSMYGDAAYDMLHFFGVLSGVDSIGFNMTPGDLDSFTQISTIWTSFGENMVGALLAGFRSKAEELSLAISETIDTAPVITPVLELGKFRKDAAGMWNNVPGGFGYNFAGTNVTKQTIDMELMNRMVDQTTEAINVVGQMVSSGLTYVGTMIGNTKFEIDGVSVAKVITPYVDAELAKSLARYLRYNSSVTSMPQ